MLNFLRGLTFYFNDGEGGGGAGDNKGGGAGDNKGGDQKPNLDSVYNKGYGDGANAGRGEVLEFVTALTGGDFDGTPEKLEAIGAKVFKRRWDGSLKETLTAKAADIYRPPDDGKGGGKKNADHEAQLAALRDQNKKLESEKATTEAALQGQLRDLTINYQIEKVVSAKGKELLDGDLAVMAYRSKRKLELENGKVIPRKLEDGTPIFDAKTGQPMDVAADFAYFLANDPTGKVLIAANASNGSGVHGGGAGGGGGASKIVVSGRNAADVQKDVESGAISLSSLAK